MGDPLQPPEKPPSVARPEAAARAEANLKGLVEVVQESAGSVLEGLGHGFERAGAALATPENADLTALLPSVDLPELEGGGPLGALALRLDREADLHRGVALRELARIAWTQRIAQTVVVAAAACEIVVAATAALLAVFGGVVEGRAGLLLLAAAFAGAAGIGVAISASRMHAAHAKLADGALGRARALEDRLFRLGLAMEWRAAGPTLFQDALARLERDASTASTGSTESTASTAPGDH